MEATQNPPLAMNISDAAALIGLGKSYLYRELRAGRISLPLIKLGNKTLIRRVDLEAWLATQVRD